MYDLNLEQQLNLHIPAIKSVNIEAEGYGKYKKANKHFQEELKLFYEDLKPKLANLLANGQISEEVYQAQLNYTKFYSLVQVEDSNLKDYNEELKSESLIALQPYREFLDAFVKREMEIKEIEKKVDFTSTRKGKTETKNERRLKKVLF